MDIRWSFIQRNSQDLALHRILFLQLQLDVVISPNSENIHKANKPTDIQRKHNYLKANKLVVRLPDAHMEERNDHYAQKYHK